jgi:ferredoxin
MATVYFADDNIRVRVPVGMTLREAARKTGSSMEFGCRVGDCTTCAAHVKAGMLYLSDKTDKELAALRMISDDIGELRLLCQCSVRSEEGEIVVSQRG